MQVSAQPSYTDRPHQQHRRPWALTREQPLSAPTGRLLTPPPSLEDHVRLSIFIAALRQTYCLEFVLFGPFVHLSSRYVH
jgi:hypothetical protein